MTKKQIQEMLDVAPIHPDRVIFSKGTVKMRFGYFYRHGQTADKKAEEVKKALPIVEILSVDDHWAVWPKDSYFEVVCKFN